MHTNRRPPKYIIVSRISWTLHNRHALLQQQRHACPPGAEPQLITHALFCHILMLNGCSLCPGQGEMEGGLRRGRPISVGGWEWMKGRSPVSEI